MGDGEGGAALAELFQRLLHQPLALVVQCAGGFVQNQDGRIFQEHPGDGDALLLPAGQLYAPFAHIGVIPVGQLPDEAVGPRLLRGSLHLLPGGAGQAVGNVFIDGAGEHVHLLLHHADVLPQAALGQLGDVLTVDQDASAADVVKPGDQVAEGGLAAAAGAYQRDLVAGLHGFVDVGQHGPVVIVIVEADVVEGHIALHAGQLLRAGRIVHVGLHVHDLAEALDARHAPLELLRVVHHPADGGQQGGNVEQIRHVVRRRDLAVDDEQRAHDDHHDVHHAVKGAGGGVVARHVAVFAAADADELLVAPVELVDLHGLVGEALHHPDAQQAVLHLSVDLAHLMAALLEGGPHLLVKIPGQHQHNGQHEENDDRQHRVDAQQDHEGHGDLDGGDQKFFRAMMGELRHIEQVAGDAGHDLPHLGVAVIGEAHLLQMLKQGVAHVPLDVGAHHVAPGHHDVVGHGVDQAQQHINAAHLEHIGHGQGGGAAAGQAGDAAHDHGQHQIAQGGQRGAEQVQRQHAPIGTEIGQKAPDQLGGFHGALVAVGGFRLHGNDAPVLNAPLVSVEKIILRTARRSGSSASAVLPDRPCARWGSGRRRPRPPSGRRPARPFRFPSTPRPCRRCNTGCRH